LIGNSWDKLLNPEYVQGALDWVSVRRERETVYPASGNELNAFRLTPPEKVKVVILGQDPYPGTDRNGLPHAHGLSFSSLSKVDIPASLQNIFKELQTEYGPLRTNANLTDWATQGVLLLNTALSVCAGKSQSHKGRHWDRVVLPALRGLTVNRTGIVFILWGRDAQAHIPYILRPDTQYALTAPHPSPMSAYTGFFGCNHFKQANEILVSQGLEPIDWFQES